MPIDVFFHLDRLRCEVETDSNGHSEPYVWTLLLWVDDTTLGSAPFVGSSAPGNVEGGRVVIKAGIQAGDDVPLPAAQQSFAHRFEDGLTMRHIGIIVVMSEQDETPPKAIRAAYDAFKEALPKAVGEFIVTNLRAPNEDERRLIADQIRPIVIAAGRDALSAFEKLQVFLGNLKLDDELGFDSQFIELETEEIPTSFTLQFETRGLVSPEDGIVTNHYEVDGRIELRAPPPPETCQAQIDAVSEAQAVVKGLQATIKGLQEELQDAAPNEKKAIIAEIRRIKEIELPAAAEALEAARQALALCRG